MASQSQHNEKKELPNIKDGGVPMDIAVLIAIATSTVITIYYVICP